MLTDFHCHCLPQMDDGAQSVEMSVLMLQRLRLQNVGKVIATPHYYPYKEDVASFMQRREVSHKCLLEHIVSPNLPEIELGAEVHLTRGLSKENLSGLCTESGIILLELPFSSFKTWMLEEIENITYQFSVTPIIAHIERYLPLYQKEDFQRLLSFEEAVWQVNNSAFSHLKTKFFVQKLIRQGYRIVLGSDAHNLSDRAPNFDRVQKYLKKYPLIH